VSHGPKSVKRGGGSAVSSPALHPGSRPAYINLGISEVTDPATPGGASGGHELGVETTGRAACRLTVPAVVGAEVAAMPSEPTSPPAVINVRRSQLTLDPYLTLEASSIRLFDTCVKRHLERQGRPPLKERASAARRNGRVGRALLPPTQRHEPLRDAKDRFTGQRVVTSRCHSPA
jgi:hypothetical protein